MRPGRLLGFGRPPRRWCLWRRLATKRSGVGSTLSPAPHSKDAEMPHFPKVRRGSRRHRAAAAQDRRLALESLQESLERLVTLDERVEALRLRYRPWAYGVTTGEFPVGEQRSPRT